MQIGPFAALAGTTPKTIRYYEQIGLLPEPARTRAGYRQYRAGDAAALAFIASAKAAGFTLREIGGVLARWRAGAEPCDHVRGVIDAKLAAIDRQLRDLAQLRERLATLRAGPGPAAGACVCAIIEGAPEPPAPAAADAAGAQAAPRGA